MSDYLMQLQKNIDVLTKRVDSLIKPETASAADYTKVAALYQSLPALRFLGLGGLGSGGEWRDASNNGMHLSYNGNPQMAYTGAGAPYWIYDGTGDFHRHADDANFDITGTETTVLASQRGLTCGAWTYFPNAATANGDAVISKYLVAGNQRSYLLYRNPSNNLRAYISVDGTTITGPVSTGTFSLSTWYFTAMRFDPSTTADCWINDTKTTQAVGVPASIFNGAALFEVGSFNSGAILHAGYKAFPFVCACALSDALITQLYQSSRGLFGV